MKLKLIALACILSLYGSSQSVQNTCATDAPGPQWDKWFNAKVEQFKKDNQNTAGKTVYYTIPVIVHVIHFGQLVGTYPNVDSNWIYSQIQVLNDDYNLNAAGRSNLPSQFVNNEANTGIKFCMALQNPQGTLLNERGIDRVSAVTNAWTDPGTMTNLKAYFTGTIMPATIWVPTKYFNIWISDRSSTLSYGGFATYPAGTGLVGLIGGTMGSTTCDGIWIYTSNFGTVPGTIAPYNKGRTCTHEIGHWLGLRHIWGDGNCLPDYCGDTPTQKGPHYGAVVSTPTDQCGVSTSPNGEMCMNFMDMTNDLYRYMFSNDQNIRMQTTMSQCANRYLLGSHGLCNNTLTAISSSAIASFSMNYNQCVNFPFTPFNLTSGFPNPTYVWSSIPGAQFLPSATLPNPNIIVQSPGLYTVTLVASNSVSSSSYSMVISASGTCAPGQLCVDSLKMVRSLDSLKSYKSVTDPLYLGCQSGSNLGFLAGTNCFQDKEFAQFYPPSSYNGFTNPQVNSVIVFFDSTGTKYQPGHAGTQICCKIYGGSISNGPTGVTGIQKCDSLGKITGTARTTTITYLGLTGQILTTTKMIPFKFDFPSPIPLNQVSGFFVSVVNPLTIGDSIRIMTSTRNSTSSYYSDSSAWYLSNVNTWRTFKTYRKSKLHLAIVPQITCMAQVGIKQISGSLSSQISVMPNPGEGLFNLVFTLPEEQNLNIKVTDVLGHEITNSRLSNVYNSVLQLDLSAKPEGIYFVSISNGNDYTVKKIILAH